MGVGALAVSWELSHPLPTSTLLVGVGVKVGGGRVAIGPVGVYVGNRFTGASAFAMESGGHGNAAVTAGPILPAPAPPVCVGWNVPSKEGPAAPTAAQTPVALRGSFGIQPFSRPSWYDQSGASTMPAVELPICD